MSEQARTTTSDAPPPKRGRYPQTALALIGAVIGCLGIVAFLVLVVVRPDAATRQSTDWHAAAEGAVSAYGSEILDPQLPAGWSANYARVGTESDLTVWEIGFLSPDDGYIGLTQTLRDAASTTIALPDVVGPATGDVQVNGRAWTVFDRRVVDAIGNYSYNLAADLPSSLVLLHGTASDAEFALVAAAIGAEVDR